MTLLAGLGNASVLMRKGRSTNPGTMESAVRTACSILNIPVSWYVPAPGGRDMVFYRDIDMVGDADLVICVFDARSPMEGGTAHVVEKAQDKHVPVYAYTCEPDDRVWQRLGEWDPDDAWGSRVPRG